MSKYHTEDVARYTIDGRHYYVTMCWEGKEPSEDPDSFYDIYNEHGACINIGEPWHNDGQGVPTHDDVVTMLVNKD